MKIIRMFSKQFTKCFDVNDFICIVIIIKSKYIQVKKFKSSKLISFIVCSVQFVHRVIFIMNTQTILS